MKRLLLITLAIIILVPLAVVSWLALFFDANDYREQLSDGFKSATGREISIAGELNTSFFPWIGIQTGAIEVANAPGFGDAPLAGIQGAKIRLKLMPLFSGEVEMETVVLEGVQANLITLENGKQTGGLAQPKLLRAVQRRKLRQAIAAKPWRHWRLAALK